MCKQVICLVLFLGAFNFTDRATADSAKIVPAAGTFAPIPKRLSRPEESVLLPGDPFRECDACPEMLVVPAGQFTIGAPVAEDGSSADERPRRTVKFSKPFAVGRFSLTFDEWDACVHDRGCGGYRPADEKWGRGKQPVINLTWYDAEAYIWWLAQKTGQPYRLLSEAEREYVTRAGSDTPFWWGEEASTERANYNGKFAHAGTAAGIYRARPLPVQSFAPNPWGFYQVHGNTADWLEDCWNPNHEGAPADGSPRKSGNCYLRLTRGGAWSGSPNVMRSASRIAFGSDIRMQYLGLRVARTLRK